MNREERQEDMKEKQKSDEVRMTVMAAQVPLAEPLHTTQL